MLQDYLYDLGYVEFKGPRKVITKSYQDGIIKDGDGWLILHEDRNILSHKYDFEESRIIYERIVSLHIPLFLELQKKLSHERT